MRAPQDSTTHDLDSIDKDVDLDNLELSQDNELSQDDSVITQDTQDSTKDKEHDREESENLDNLDIAELENHELSADDDKTKNSNLDDAFDDLSAALNSAFDDIALQDDNTTQKSDSIVDDFNIGSRQHHTRFRFHR